MMVMKRSIKPPGDDWRTMTEFVIDLEVDGHPVHEVAFHSSYPLDLAIAYEKFSGIVVNFHGDPGFVQVRV